MRSALLLVAASLLLAAPVRAEDAVEPVVGVPVHDGQAGQPQPGVLIHPAKKIHKINAATSAYQLAWIKARPEPILRAAA